MKHSNEGLSNYNILWQNTFITSCLRLLISSFNSFAPSIGLCACNEMNSKCIVCNFQLKIDAWLTVELLLIDMPQWRTHTNNRQYSESPDFYLPCYSIYVVHRFCSPNYM